MSDELTIRELDFEATFHPARNALVLSGSGDASVAAKLQALVEVIHARGQSIAIDLRDVEFMAASCFHTFVRWVGLIHELPAEARYQLRFTIDASTLWQRKSLASLTSFAPDLVSQ